jgi:hypothetical protein
MSKLVRGLALGVGLTLTLALSTACEPAQATTATNTVDVRCQFLTYSVETDWYFPAGTPRALVWLQHGFTESKDDWDETARKLAESGYLTMATTLPTADIFGCTVSNVGNNTPFLNNVASMLAGIGNPSSAIGRSHADAATRAGRAGQAIPDKLLMSGHSAGGEAVLHVANRLRTNHAGTFARLRGLVLADPVSSFIGDNTGAALEGLSTTTVPIYSIAAPPYSCNSDQSGTAAVIAELPGRFHGAQITTGAHGDIFGGSANALGTATCGTPQATNVNAARVLMFGWFADMETGATTPAFYPGGTVFQALVGQGTITALP